MEITSKQFCKSVSMNADQLYNIEGTIMDKITSIYAYHSDNDCFILDIRRIDSIEGGRIDSVSLTAEIIFLVTFTAQVVCLAEGNVIYNCTLLEKKHDMLLSYTIDTFRAMIIIKENTIPTELKDYYVVGNTYNVVVTNIQYMQGKQILPIIAKPHFFIQPLPGLAESVLNFETTDDAAALVPQNWSTNEPSGDEMINANKIVEKNKLYPIPSGDLAKAWNAAEQFLIPNELNPDNPPSVDEELTSKYQDAIIIASPEGLLASLRDIRAEDITPTTHICLAIPSMFDPLTQQIAHWLRAQFAFVASYRPTSNILDNYLVFSGLKENAKNPFPLKIAANAKCPYGADKVFKKNADPFSTSLYKACLAEAYLRYDFRREIFYLLQSTNGKSPYENEALVKLYKTVRNLKR